MIRQISKKQAQKNRAVAKIKSELPLFCCVCGKEVKCLSELDAMHLLPKLKYPEYYTAVWNIKGGCRECHNLFDNDLKFRQRQTHLYEIVKEHDEKAAYCYFQI